MHLPWSMPHIQALARNVTRERALHAPSCGICRALGVGEDPAHPSNASEPAVGPLSTAGGGVGAAVRQRPPTAAPVPAPFPAAASPADTVDAAQAIAGTTHAEHDHRLADASSLDAPHRHHLHANRVTAVSMRLSQPVDLQRCALAAHSPVPLKLFFVMYAHPDPTEGLV